MDIVAKVREALEPIEELRVAYLFGSRVCGGVHAESDLDLAIFLARDADTHRTERRIYDALALALGALGEKADLLDLARCGSAIAFRVLREGTRVLGRTERERVALEARIMRRYDDDAPHRRRFRLPAGGGGPS